MPPEIIDTTIAARTKAKNVFICNSGVVKPRIDDSFTVNPVIIMFGTNFVNKYKMKAFVNEEKNPREMRLKGKVKTLNIGFKSKNIMVRVKLPKSSVNNPPCMVTPEIIAGRRNNVTA